jgi:hypothetical protein
MSINVLVTLISKNLISVFRDTKYKNIKYMEKHFIILIYQIMKYNCVILIVLHSKLIIKYFIINFSITLNLKYQHSHM